MLANFGKTGTIVEAHFQTRAVLTEITKRFPAQMWERVSEYLERRDDFLRAHYLERWLTGENTSDPSFKRRARRNITAHAPRKKFGSGSMETWMIVQGILLPPLGLQPFQ